MNSIELQEFYARRYETFTTEAKQLTKRINAISNLRLATALASAALLYFGFQDNFPFYFLPLPIGVFVLLIRYHAGLFERREHIEHLAEINRVETGVIEGNVDQLYNGAVFVDPHHHYTHDLDIFGDGSLYQYVNRCNTVIGRKKMAQRLSCHLNTPGEIEEHQKAIQELATLTDFRQHFDASGKEISEEEADRHRLLAWLGQPSFLSGRPFYPVVLTVVPLISVVLLAGLLFSDTFRPFVILMAAFQWAFLGFHAKRVNSFHESIGRRKNILQKYARLLHHLDRQTFSSPLLTRISQTSRHAAIQVKKLAGLVNALDARANSLVSIVVNSFLLYDLQCVYRLEKWKDRNAMNLALWLETVSETEVLSSIGTFAFNNPKFIYPKIHNEFALQATELGHPLIPANECVVNDISLGNGPSVMIVTGANMAGKSTFLRTLGVNLVLALNGAPVAAGSFACPVVSLRTGMRTADSLKEHQSYFYAELDRLKGIMDDLRRDVPLLILLDEILKGTNSDDKQSGSVALVKQLIAHRCLAIIATHDLALGDLEIDFPQKINNYSFEATIRDDQLSFDYKLKKGKAQTMNATFLMKKMGIIPA